jgi:hypothetical protein
LKVRAASKASTAKAEPILKISPQMRWNRANREARAAHHALRAALRRGDIKRGPCAVCGSLRTDGHHPDHSKALEVVWLCRKHHRQLHAAERRLAA